MLTDYLTLVKYVNIAIQGLLTKIGKTCILIVLRKQHVLGKICG